MKKVEGTSWTAGIQGSVLPYPPIVVKLGGRWTYIEGSEYHGGSVCRICGGECQLWQCIQVKADSYRRLLNRGKWYTQLPRITVEEFLKICEVRK